jgi:hypothetical protein
MKRVLVLVEGQTEERFVKDVLCPYLWEKEIDLTPKIVTTKRVKIGPHFKGGITEYSKVETDVRILLYDTNATAITTFIDYYALPPDFPGMASRPQGTPIQRVLYVENEWAVQVNNHRFHPFLMIHEFEAILFCKPDEIGLALNQQRAGRDLAQVREAFDSPEDINEGIETAPSKRILRYCVAYRKTVHGPIVAKRIGLPVIREQCNHFDNWISWLETL